MPDVARSWAVAAADADVEALEEEARAVARHVMSKEIRYGTADLTAAKEEAGAEASRRIETPGAAALVAGVVQQEIAPTHRYDQEATDAARAEAARRVQDVVRTIEADQPILFEGERVTGQHLAMLEALGLSGPRLDYPRTTSVVAIAGLISLLLWLQTRRWAPEVYRSWKRLVLLSLLAVTSLFVVNLLTLALPNVWMLVVPAAALMAAVLLADTVGMVLALSLSLLVGLMATPGFPALALALGSAAPALAWASSVWPVSRLWRAVGAMAATNLVLVVAVGMLQAQPVSGTLREAGLAALVYAPGAAVLGIGGILLLQRPFGITTELGLLELSNPQMPLLRRLQADAPGTYHHSLMVANLAEAAAEAIGADAVLTRVGALYHDIGKLDRPAFFVENQALLGAENIHDRLSSSLSSLVIIAHAKDGADLARRHRLPPEIVDIVAQHHGTTLVRYFYQQALTGERPESVSEDQYRYPGPLPETKEAALVMLADGVQAAVRSIEDPTPHRVEQRVREIIRDRAVYGQLSECHLTFRDLAVVEMAMSRVLTAALIRNRIEYPEQTAVQLRE
jgi:hypothetical protein